MHRLFLHVIAISTGFVGAIFGFISSTRTSSMFTVDGVILGHGHECWFMQNCGLLGFALIAIAFLLQLIISTFDILTKVKKAKG